MAALDVQTLLIVLIALSLAIGTPVAAFSGPRRGTGALWYWALSLLALAAGSLLLVLREFVPTLLSVMFGNALVICALALAGNVACRSLEVIPTVSVTFVTAFQFASTDRTVTLKAVPAAWETGVPVLPRLVPGAAGDGLSAIACTRDRDRALVGRVRRDPRDASGRTICFTVVGDNLRLGAATNAVRIASRWYPSRDPELQVG